MCNEVQFLIYFWGSPSPILRLTPLAPLHEPKHNLMSCFINTDSKPENLTYENNITSHPLPKPPQCHYIGNTYKSLHDVLASTPPLSQSVTPDDPPPRERYIMVERPPRLTFKWCLHTDASMGRTLSDLVHYFTPVSAIAGRSHL